MSFSLGASKKIAARFGSVEKMGNLLDNEGEVTEKTIDGLVFVLELLICQGCAYKNFFEADTPKDPKAPVDSEGRYVPPTTEELEIACGITDIKAISKSLAEAIGKSNQTEVETQPDDKKNEGAMPVETR